MTENDFGMMRLNSAWLQAHGLPIRQYPIPIAAFKAIIETDGRIRPEHLLFWLQLWSEAVADWREFESAMAVLITTSARRYASAEVKVEGETSQLVCGPVNLDHELVTVQRDDLLLAAVERNPRGGLRCACYRPLDGKAIRYLLRLAAKPASDGTVCMRADNFEYAKDASAGMGNFYAYQRGESHLSYWEHGLGLTREKVPLSVWREYLGLTPLRPPELAVQLGVHWQLAERLRIGGYSSLSG